MKQKLKMLLAGLLWCLFASVVFFPQNPIVVYAQSAITALGELTALADADNFAVVDVSDTSQSANGTTKKITAANIKSYLFDNSPVITTPALNGARLNDYMGWPTVTAFPSTPAVNDTVIVTDDSIAGACDSAAGSARTICMWTGSVWTAVGDGNPAGDVTAASAFATDNSCLRADGTGKGAQATGTNCTLSDGGNMSLAGTISASNLAPLLYNGQKALSTGAISSTACATETAITATGASSTSKVMWNFSADVTAVTGYAPVTTGGLQIFVWPSTDAINIKVCNPTASSITPGAVTLNVWAF